MAEDGYNCTVDYDDELEETEDTCFLKVNLKYPNDYEAVKNLPSKRMKRSSKKRVRGMARKVLASVLTTFVALTTPVVSEVYHAVVEPLRDFYAVTTGHRQTDEPALLELFAGSAHLTTTFAKAGYNVLEPRDLLYGHNMFDAAQQREVLYDIEHFRPKLLWVALPCTKWSPWQRLNYAQRRQQLRRHRTKQRKLVRFAADCAWRQLELGNEVIFEHPKASDMWVEPLLQQFTEPELGIYWGQVDMCQYNLRAVSDGGVLKKPTTLMCSDFRMVQELAKTCPGGHEHTMTAGQNTRPAGIYTKEFCNAVVKAFKESSRSVWAKDGDDAWEAFVNEAEAPAPPEEGDDRPGASGISVPNHIQPATASALKRIHQNLGHPSNHDLARHLRLSGASDLVVAAAQGLRCTTCERMRQPGTKRPARVVRPLDFNQEVCVDILNLYDLDNNKVEAMSILDLATGYHVVKRIRGKKSTDYLEDFNDFWMGWAGPPEQVTVDQERGFLKEFVDGLEKTGTTVRFIAGQAHWQQGAIERQGQWFRSIWDKTLAHVVPQPDELNYVMAMVAAAKNNLRRKHGYSPSQWLFGKEPRAGDGAVDEDERLLLREELQPPGQEWERRQKIRQAAREAFLHSQAEEATKRAVWGRSRVLPKEFQPGDYVYIYCADRSTAGKARHRQNVGEWIGPGVVIGKEGSSYWVSRGGRCLLCAGEHVRPAESEELGGAFQSRVLKEDLLQLVEGMEDDKEDIFADARDPYHHSKRSLAKDGEVPERRMRKKGHARMVKRKADGELQREEGARRTGLGEDIPVPGDMSGLEEDVPAPDMNELFGDCDYSPTTEGEDADINAVYVTEQRKPKSLIKQSDKEIACEKIPEEERQLYVQAEAKQWEEHLRYGAVRVHLPEDAEVLRRKVPRERVIKARFAYRDKHVVKRREDPTVPCKAKARLCVGGHMDPDLKTGELNTEAPTAGKMSMFVALFLASQMHWKLAAGDVEAAFLNGVEAKRGFYFEPPRRGLDGVPEGSLIEIVKGVFGLVTSPRLWWEKLAEELRKIEVKVQGEVLRFEHHPLDPCLLLLRGEDGRLHGLLLTHVDDLLLATSPGTMEETQAALSAIFPIADWEMDNFDYTGSNIKQNGSIIEVSQKPYVNTRLETVDIPKNVGPNDLADQVTKQHNMSTIGALS